MKKAILSVCILAAAVSLAAAAPRLVVAEHATQWNCGYCPGPNAALDALLSKYPVNLAAIRYHGWWPGTNNDPFYLANTTENAARINYYSIASYGVPAHVVDGDTADFQVDENRVIQALALASPIDLSMTVAYDTLSRSGQITWTAKAVSSVPAANLRLRIAITESEVYYASAGTNGEHWFHQAMRDMVPDANGTSISLVNSGDSVTQTTDFTLSSSWNADNCEIVAFVQSDDIPKNSPSIYQGAKYAMNAKLVQTGSNLQEDGGNGNGYFDPTENVNLTVEVLNAGGNGTGASVTMSCADTFVTLGNASWDIGAMAFGDSSDNAGGPFTLTIKPTAPIGRRINLVITKHIVSTLTAHATDKVDTVWFLVGTPETLFSDDFEGELGSWTRSGSGGSANWDTTSATYNSPNHCLTDSRTGNYVNNVNRYAQMSAGVNLQSYTGATVSWWERYSTEGGYDFCRPEKSINGGSTWTALVAAYSGLGADWQKVTVDVSQHCGTVADFRIRFRITSDTYVVADGWYVDDVLISGYKPAAGVESGTTVSTPVTETKLLSAYPNPVGQRTLISYQLAAPGRVSLGVYDVAGRLVRTLESGHRAAGLHKAAWDGRDNAGKPAANGVYFYRLTTGDYTATRKLTIVR